MSFVCVCGHSGNPGCVVQQPQHLSWVKPALPAPCRGTAGSARALGEHLCLWSSSAVGMPPGVCAGNSSSSSQPQGGAGQGQDTGAAQGPALCSQTCPIPAFLQNSQQRQGSALRLQSQAELLLGNQSCDTPKLCCSSRALLLPPRGFPNPTAATPARTWEDLLAQGTDPNSGVPLWDVSGLWCKTLICTAGRETEAQLWKQLCQREWQCHLKW